MAMYPCPDDKDTNPECSDCRDLAAEADADKGRKLSRQCSRCYHTSHYHCPVCGACSTSERCPVIFCIHNAAKTVATS